MRNERLILFLYISVSEVVPAPRTASFLHCSKSDNPELPQKETALILYSLSEYRFV
jgi:hypothetical protein